MACRADAVALWERGARGLRRTARCGVTPDPSGLELEEYLVELPGPGRSSLDGADNPTWTESVRNTETVAAFAM
jgi:hypothetical protein